MLGFLKLLEDVAEQIQQLHAQTRSLHANANHGIVTIYRIVTNYPYLAPSTPLLKKL